MNNHGPAKNMKQRIVFSITMSLILTTLMTAWVTFINLGLGSHYLASWFNAFVLSWPAAAVASFAIAPLVQRITARLAPQ